MNPSYIAANWTPEIWKYRKYQHAFPYATCFNTEKIQVWRYLANLNHSKQLAYVFPQYHKKKMYTDFQDYFWILRWSQSYFWRNSLESMMYLTHRTKPDLANSVPVSSKRNFEEVLTHFEGSEFGFLKSRSYFPSL